MRTLIGLFVLSALLGGVPAKADLIAVYLSFNIENDQTGPSTVLPYGTFFSAAGYYANPGDYTSGTLAYPGPGNPQAMSPESCCSPGVYYQTQYLAGPVALQAAYPLGTYTVQAFGSGAPSSAVGVSYTSNAYGNTPSLTAASFNALQGLNPGVSDTVSFNGFTPSGVANASSVFFSIFNMTTGVDLFSTAGLSPSTTGVVIPSGTLAANASYGYELIYDDRIDGVDLNGSGILTQQLFDTRTFGSFTTAAPEPGYFPLLALLGFAGMLVERRRATNRRWSLTRYRRRSRSCVLSGFIKSSSDLLPPFLP